VIDLPQPLTPADCDLRDFQFMPLDVVRVRDSDIAAISEGDEFRCAVLLWCAAWHQVPAASLPDDDKVLSQLAGFGRVIKEWQKCREGALRGWLKCSDGRLYHPVVAEKANEAWAGRVKYREKKEAERLRKAEERRLKKEQDDANKSAGRPMDSDCLSGGQLPKNDDVSAGSPQENALTVDSGQWTVERDSGQLTSKDHTSSQASTEVGQPESLGETIPKARNVQIALLLRAQGVQATAQHPTVCVTWANDAKVTDDVLNVAIARAKAAKPDESIPVKYLARVVETLLEEHAAPPPDPKAKQREDYAWAASNQGIDAKARELRIRVLPSHTYADVKQMCFDEIRKRKAQAPKPEGAAA
jgi:hypothetical protein